MSMKSKYLHRASSAVKRVRRWCWLWWQDVLLWRAERRRAAGKPDLPPRKLSLLPRSAFRFYVTGLSMLITGLGCQLVSVWLLVRLLYATADNWRRYTAWMYFFVLLGWLLIHGAGRIIRSEKLSIYL
jgi:hypothetical protein